MQAQVPKRNAVAVMPTVVVAVVSVVLAEPCAPIIHRVRIASRLALVLVLVLVPIPHHGGLDVYVLICLRIIDVEGIAS